MQIYHPATQEAEAGRIANSSPLTRLQSEFKNSLDNLVRPYLKLKSRNVAWDIAQGKSSCLSIWKALVQSPSTAGKKDKPHWILHA